MAGRACVRREGLATDEEEEQQDEVSDVPPTVYATSDKSPSKARHRKESRSRLKNTAACQCLGWCPPVLGVVARQFSGWLPAGGARTTQPMYPTALL